MSTRTNWNHLTDGNVLMWITCDGKRILAVLRGWSRESPGANRARRELSAFTLTPYWWPGEFAEFMLNGNEIRGYLPEEKLAERVPPFPCPRHPGGHPLDGPALAAEVNNSDQHGRKRATRVPVRRVQAVA